MSQPLVPCRGCEYDDAWRLAKLHVKNGRKDDLSRNYWACTRFCAKCKVNIKMHMAAWASYKRGEMKFEDLRFYCRWRNTEAHRRGQKYECSGCGYHRV